MNRIYKAKIGSRDFTPALISNGMLGIRPGLDPLKAGVCVVPGFITKVQAENESQVMAPYPFAGRIIVGDREAGESVPVSQELDMDTGELTSVCEYDDGEGGKLRIKTVIAALRTIPTMLAMRMTVYYDEPEKVSVILKPEFQGNSGCCDIENALGDTECYQTYICKTPLSSLGITIAQKRTGENEIYAAACMVTDFYNPMPETESRRISSYAAMIGLDNLLVRNEAVWSDIWKSAPVIEGPDWAQKASDEAFFYLISAAHRCSRLGVACYAQSNPYNLQGQIFWDMDFYTTPALMLLQHETA